jgi:protein SCO1/2
VDPKRDSPALLKQYIGYFDPTFVGLTGSEEELEEVSEKYMARFRTRESSSAVGYFVDHTTFMYLIDTQGKVRYLFTPDASRQIVIEGVKTVLAGTS